MVDNGGGRYVLLASSGFVMEDVLVVGGLLAVQCVLAGYVVFVSHVLAVGANPLTVIVVGAASSAIFFLPFAVALERKKWPDNISPTMAAQFVLIALGGTTVFQELMLVGIKKTTPAVASAMPNLAPGLIFTIAACFRLERFERSCKYTGAKVVGTLVCLAGAMAMSFLQSPQSIMATAYHDWLLGCSCLFAGVVVFSFCTVLQAATLASFPAPLTMCAATSMMGAVFTAALQVAVEGRIDLGSPEVGVDLVAGIVVLGGGVVGACVVFQTWCLGKKGPLLVSIFGPVQTVCSAVLSALFFRQMLTLGSLAGILLMFCGLYVVLWAKNREDQLGLCTQGDDAEKALLS